MREITKTVYTFGELLEQGKAGKVSERAIDRARAWMIDAATDGQFWAECNIDEWTRALSQIGFEDAEISYSGFGSQGDGASFTCKSVDLDKLIAFMASDVASGPFDDADLRPWIVSQVNGKTPPNVKYRHIPVDYCNAAVTRHTSRYVHENTCRFEVESRLGYRERPRIEAIVESFQSDVEHLRHDICRAIYRALEETYQAETEDEALTDLSEANDWTFNANGRFES